jgi:hypothetical protein
MGMLISIAALVIIPRVASAEMWTAHTVLEPERSVQTCVQDPVSYTLDVTNNTFTATSQFGRMVSVPVPANGEIDKTYTRAGGHGVVSLRMKGNVTSRELEVSMATCRYKLISD